jgi:hypothetical protein
MPLSGLGKLENLTVRQNNCKSLSQFTQLGDTLKYFDARSNQIENNPSEANTLMILINLMKSADKIYLKDNPLCSYRASTTINMGGGPFSFTIPDGNGIMLNSLLNERCTKVPITKKWGTDRMFLNTSDVRVNLNLNLHDIIREE